MSDFVDSVVNALKVRLNNSFLSSVIISWPLVNYKFIMVVFGEGNYKEKITYIDSILYEPDLKALHFFYIPVLLGLFYVLIFPFIEILMNIIGMFFKNLERRLVFWRQRRDIVSIEEKESYFSEVNAVKQGLLQELNTMRTSHAEKMQEIDENALGIQQRFQNVVFQNITYSLGEPLTSAPMLTRLWNNGHIEDSAEAKEYVRKVIESQLYSDLRKFATSLSELNYATETRVVNLNRDDIRRYSGVSEEFIDNFIDAVLAFGILKEFGHPNLKFRTEIKSV